MDKFNIGDAVLQDGWMEGQIESVRQEADGQPLYTVRLVFGAYLQSNADRLTHA